MFIVSCCCSFFPSLIAFVKLGGPRHSCKQDSLQRVTGKNSTLKWKQENLLFNPNDKCVKLPHDILITSLPWSECLKSHGRDQGSFCRTFYARLSSNLSLCPTVVSVILCTQRMLNKCVYQLQKNVISNWFYLHTDFKTFKTSPRDISDIRENLHVLGHVVPQRCTSASLLGSGRVL